MRVFNKQWKRIFEIRYVNEFGQPVDTNGLIHDKRALRAVQPADEPWEQKDWKL